MPDSKSEKPTNRITTHSRLRTVYDKNTENRVVGKYENWDVFECKECEWYEVKGCSAVNIERSQIAVLSKQV